MAEGCRVSELRAFLESTCTVVIDADRQAELIGQVASISQPDLPRDSLVFVTERAAPRLKLELSDLTALAAIVPVGQWAEYTPGSDGPALVAWSANPRLDYARAVARFFISRVTPGIDPAARVSPSASVGDGVAIGAGCSIGASTIGAESVIGPGCHVGDRITIGERCILHPGVVIGTPGFGYERDEAGAPIGVPHLGTVVVDDDVEIGANSCIDRATIGETTIGARTKIDNLVHIAHNVTIAEECLIAASAVVAGSSRIGRGVWIGPGAVISDGIVVGDGASVSLGAVVVRDVPAGSRVTGNFAVDHDRFMSSWKRLD